MPQVTYVYDQSQGQQRPAGTAQLLREQNNDDTYVEERWVENGSGGIEMGNTEIRSSETGPMTPGMMNGMNGDMGNGMANGMMNAGMMNNGMMGGMGNGTAPMQPRQNDGLHMESMLSVDMLDGPTSSGEMLRASLKGLLMRNIGFYVVVSFLVGTAEPVVWEGILHSVGTDYILLYQPDLDRYISGDIYSLKFVEFHNTRTMTPWAGYRRYDGMSNGW